ncbi:MAG: transcriptional regulator [Verrucomicrobia bacterium 61-8]|nr:MAG: transcriptional regulator [Verrucomicrobia bacterium 61-8]
MANCVKRRGVIIGKFMPPHRGHQYLVEFGQNYVDEIVVMVCSIRKEPIPGHLRFQWMKEFFPNALVVHHNEEIPQEPSDHPDFWTIWKTAVQRYAGSQIEYVFASEDYGWKLAEILCAQYIPVNHERSLVPISATKIRDNPFQHWEYILPSARPYFLKRVAIVGPESTGKTTMARELAKYYRTVCVEEYARGLLNFTNGWCEKHHIPLIARGHHASEEALARQANCVLFSDTDLLTTTVWSDMLFKDCPEWIREMARNQHFDLTLLLDCDLPWENDGQRYMPKEGERRALFNLLKERLEQQKRPYIIIRGSGQSRLAAAIQEVDRMIFRNTCDQED